MKPEMMRFIQEGLPGLITKMKEEQRQIRLKGFQTRKSETIDGWIGNAIVREDDVRNIAGDIIYSDLNTMMLQDPTELTPLYSEEKREFNIMKRQVHLMEGERKRVGEFLLACYEEKFEELSEVIEQGKAFSDLASAFIKFNQYQASKEVIRDYPELGRDDYTEQFNEIDRKKDNLRAGLMVLGNVYGQLLQGGELDLQVLDWQQGPNETLHDFHNRIHTETHRIQGVADAQGKKTDVLIPATFDYDGLFSQVAQREEFSDISINMEELVSEQYRRELIDSSENIVPEQIDFSVEVYDYISPEELEEAIQKRGERKERVNQYFEYVKTRYGTPEIYRTSYQAAETIRRRMAKERLEIEGNMEQEDSLLFQDMAYLQFGTVWFDENINLLMNKEYVKFLKDHDMDVLDTIYIGGQTVREKYGEQVKDMPSYLAEAELKSFLTMDMMRAEEPIQIAHFSERDNGILYVDTISDVKRRITPFQKTQKERQAYQQKLDRVNAPETLAQNRAILQWKSRELEEIQQEGRAVGDVHVQADWVKQDSLQMDLSDVDIPYGDWQSEKWEAIEGRVGIFNQIFGDSLEGLDQGYLNEMHIHHPEQLFYIDGKPAFDGKRTFNQERVKGDIVNALLSGEHRVSLAVPERDEFGNVRIQVVDVKPDLHQLEWQVGTFEKGRAEKADVLWANDSEKTARDAQIRDSMSAHLLEGVRAQERKKGYEVESKRWIFGEGGIAQGQKFMNGQYTTQELMNIWGDEKTVLTQPFDDILDDDKFDVMATREVQEEVRHWNLAYLSAQTPSQKAAVRMAYTAKSIGIPKDDFLRNEAVMEQLLYTQIMRDHPDVRLADLMAGGNPDPLEHLKEETGRQLAEKMGSVEGFSQVMADSFEWMSQLDLGREAEYAAGIPENLPLEERRAMLKQPDKDMAVTSFYAGMASLVEEQWNLYARALPKDGYQQSGIVPYSDEQLTEMFPNENQRTFYKGIREKMTDADMARFNHARAVATRVTSANRVKRNIMLRDNFEVISETDAIASAEATVFNEQMAERGTLNAVHMRTGVYLSGDQSVIEQMQGVSVEERRKITQGQVPKEWETIVREQGRQSSNMLLDASTDEMKAVMQALEAPIPKKTVPVQATANQFSYDIESLSADAELSEELKQALEENYRKGRIVSSVQQEFFAKHPEIPVEKRGDIRDIQVMMDTEDLNDMQVQMQATSMVEDYYSSDPNRRKKVLDTFFDRIDATNVMDWDLSVLTSNPPKTEAQRKKSEQDVFHMFQAVAYDQTIAIKAKENPDYFNERYADPKKRAHLQNYLNLMVALDTYAYSCVLYNSEMNQGGMQRVRGIKSQSMMDSASVAQTSLKLYQEREDFLNGKEPDTSIPFLATKELERTIGIEKKPRPLDSATIHRTAIDLRMYFGPMFTNTGQDWADAGIEHLGQLFYIDGKSAEELFKGTYAHLPEKERQDAIQAEIMSAIMKGESHVDMASFLRGPDGGLTVHMNAIHADLHGLDKAEKKQKGLFETANSKKAERTWKSDKGRTARLQAEKIALSEKMAAHVQKKMIEKHQKEWIDKEAEAVKAAQTAKPQRKRSDSIKMSIDEVMKEEKGAESTQPKRKRSASVKAPTPPRLDMGERQVKK